MTQEEKDAGFQHLKTKDDFKKALLFQWGTSVGLAKAVERLIQALMKESIRRRNENG